MIRVSLEFSSLAAAAAALRRLDEPVTSEAPVAVIKEVKENPAKPKLVAVVPTSKAAPAAAAVAPAAPAQTDSPTLDELKAAVNARVAADGHSTVGALAVLQEFGASKSAAIKSEDRAACIRKLQGAAE